MPAGRELVEALATMANERIGGAQLFSTWTFRDPVFDSPGERPLGYDSVGYGGAVRAIEGHLRGLAAVYPGIAAFVAMEPHLARVAPHFHGLLGGLEPDVPEAIESGRRRGALLGPAPAAREASVEARHATALMWEAWWREYGFAKVMAVRGDGAAMYVGKYSLKAGDRVPWWGLWTPGQLRNEWVRESKMRRSHGR